MLEIGMSWCLFWIFSFYFYHLLKHFFYVSNVILLIIACILALPTLHLSSVIFIFEVHFIVFSFIMGFVARFILKREIYSTKIMLCIMIFSLTLSFLFVAYGQKNMDQIVRTEYRVTTNKPISDDLSIAMIADLHYPSATSKKELKKLIQRIEKEKADLLILNGDIIDEHTTMKQRIEVFQMFTALSKESRILYVLGNHDLGTYSLFNEIDYQTLENIVQSCGITLLKDDVLQWNHDILIIGRDDYQLKTRKNVSDIISNDNKEKYIIVLDHQPRELDILANSYVDLHLSGHVHAGQIFPLYYVYELFNINELNYGIEKRQKMTAINTSGVAGWGFPVRTQKHSEYVIIRVKKSHCI